MRQTRRPAWRALALPPAEHTTLGSLHEASARLEALAKQLGVTATGPATFVLVSDPIATARADWQWQPQLPIRGAVPAEGRGEARLERGPGGTHVEVRVPGGLDALEGFYRFFLQEFLPRYKHELARPLIVHRAVGEPDRRNPERIDLLVAVPVAPSIAPAS
jgi:hypothetical protein